MRTLSGGSPGLLALLLSVCKGGFVYKFAGGGGKAAAAGREGEGKVIGRGRVTGPNSWAPAASVILRNKETEKTDLETDINRDRTVEMGETHRKTARENPTETEGSARACSDSDVIFLQLPLSPSCSPHLCPSFLSNPTARHPCLSFSSHYEPGPRSGVNRFSGLKAE